MLPVMWLGDQLTICSQVKKYRILFLRFTHEDPKAQKYLLGGIEQVIALHKDSLLPKVPGIFKVILNLVSHF
jgi:translation initiation factor 5